MKTLSILATSLLFFSNTLSTIIPLDHFQRIANDPNAPEDVRNSANFTYHHTVALQNRREKHIAAGQGEGFDPNLDDDAFDIEQDPDYAAQIAYEREQMQLAQANMPVEPGAIEGGGGPDDRRRSVHSRIKRQAIPQAYIGVWEDDQSCHTAPPARKVRESGSPVAADNVINELFTNLQFTEEFYRTQVPGGRYSINGTGGSIWATAHYCVNYNNAVWNGEQQLYGDADGYAYVRNSFSNALSIVAHEFTHGVIQFTNPLYYEAQSGALNEHLADVFGQLVLQWSNNQNAYQATWLVGQGTVVGGRASRDFANPGTAYNTPALGPDRQVGNYQNYYNGPDDNFGVHFNSGIPNRAFYLFAQQVGGYAWIGAPGSVWYDVLVGNAGKFDYRGENFVSFAQKTINSAFRLYGAYTANILRGVWQQVGVYP